MKQVYGVADSACENHTARGKKFFILLIWVGPMIRKNVA